MSTKRFIRKVVETLFCIYESLGINVNMDLKEECVCTGEGTKIFFTIH